MAGNFNMVQARQDKTKPHGRLVPASEQALFMNLKRHLQVEDNLRLVNSLPFSWDNFRDDNNCIFARLDRIYLFENGPGRSQHKILDYTIKGDNGWSDHFLV